MSEGFKISEEHYPVLDWKGRTTEEGPKVTARSWVIARWESSRGLPTTGDVMDAVSEMKLQFPGREKDYRIMGLPKPGDHLFGVEVA